MLLISHKMVFTENEDVLLCVQLCEKMKGHLQLQFTITKFSFCGTLSKRILEWEQGLSKS